MAVRQYIGARYVPKFSDVNNGEWDNSYTYEPLTIVKYGNDFYTSKIPVPVGVSISDTKYWVLTGNYNGAISNLDGRVTTLENNMQFVVTDRSDIHEVDATEGNVIISENSYAGDGHVSTWIVGSDTADGYLTIALDNGKSASLVHDKNIYVHDVGAFPDGNNCENAINAALNISGVTLLFDVGEYRFDGRIWLSDYQKIRGQGEDTILYCSKDPAGNHGEFIGVIHDSGAQIKGVRLSDFAIRIYSTTAEEDVNPIGVNNAKDLIIENIHILNSNWRGIQIECGANGGDDIIVRNCVIENTKLNCMGVSHASGGHLTNVLIEHCHFKEPAGGYGGLLLSGVSTSKNTRNITVRNCRFDITADMPRAIYVLNCVDVTLENIDVRCTASQIGYAIQCQESNYIRMSNIYMSFASGTEMQGIGILSCVSVQMVNVFSYLADIGVRVVKSSGGITPLHILLSNSIQTGGRYLCVVSETGVDGFVTGSLCTGTAVLSSSSSDFKEITA